MRNSGITFLFLMLIQLHAVGCSFLKASEAPDFGFVPMPELMSKQPDHRPFHKAWVAGQPLASIRQIRSQIFIAPVNTEILEKRYAAIIQNDEARQIQIDEAQELAKYFANRCKLTLKSYTQHPLLLVDKTTENALSLELALVELIPTNPIVNLVGSAAGYLVPGGGLIKIAGKGSIAMEGMIADSFSGEYLERFKDREEDKASAFSLKDFQRYAHLRVAIDDWCSQLVEILAKPASQDTADSVPLTLNPF